VPLLRGSLDDAVRQSDADVASTSAAAAMENL